MSDSVLKDIFPPEVLLSGEKDIERVNQHVIALVKGLRVPVVTARQRLALAGHGGPQQRRVSCLYRELLEKRSGLGAPYGISVQRLDAIVSKDRRYSAIGGSLHEVHDAVVATLAVVQTDLTRNAGALLKYVRLHLLEGDLELYDLFLPILTAQLRLQARQAGRRPRREQGAAPKTADPPTPEAPAGAPHEEATQARRRQKKTDSNHLRGISPAHLRRFLDAEDEDLASAVDLLEEARSLTYAPEPGECTTREQALKVDRRLLLLVSDIIAALEACPRAEKSGVTLSRMVEDNDRQLALRDLRATLEWAQERVLVGKLILETWQDDIQNTLCSAFLHALAAADKREYQDLCRDGSGIIEWEQDRVKEEKKARKKNAGALVALEARSAAQEEYGAFMKTMQDIREGKDLPAEVLARAADYYEENYGPLPAPQFPVPAHLTEPLPGLAVLGRGRAEAEWAQAGVGSLPSGRWRSR